MLNDYSRRGAVDGRGLRLPVIAVRPGAPNAATTGAWSSGTTGAQLSAEAFTTGMPGPGGWIVSFGMVIFAFSTMLAWSYYGERTAEYLFGSRIVMPYRLIWVVAVFVGAVAELDLVWLIADVMNALMAIPNLIALVLLAPVVFKLTRTYFDKA